MTAIVIFWGLAALALAPWLVEPFGQLVTGWRRRSIGAATGGATPRLSVIVAALDEEATIEPAMRTLLALDYPDLEVIAVDDRSTDATGAILDRIADPRLKVVHVRELPSGWLGKNHAMHVGAAQATGEWLLFTDADVHFAKDALRRAVAFAESRSLDHLALLPQLASGGWAESVMVGLFGVAFMLHLQPWWRGSWVGVGAFNMVRASAYRRAGGHAALPMDVLDDVKLGKRLVATGATCALADGTGFVRVRWVVGVGGIVRGLTKNMFAAMKFRWWMPFVASAAVLGMAVWPLAGVWVGPVGARALCAVSIIAMVLHGWRDRRMTNGPALQGLGYPLAAVVFAYIMFRSMIATYVQGGVKWRGTLYRLEELKRNVT